MEVLVEILLALLAQPSHLIRQVARTVFSHVCAHLTPRALQLILDVSWGLQGNMGPRMWLSKHEGCHISPWSSLYPAECVGPRHCCCAALTEVVLALGMEGVVLPPGFHFPALTFWLRLDWARPGKLVKRIQWSEEVKGVSTWECPAGAKPRAERGRGRQCGGHRRFREAAGERGGTCQQGAAGWADTWYAMETIHTSHPQDKSSESEDNKNSESEDESEEEESDEEDRDGDVDPGFREQLMAVLQAGKALVSRSSEAPVPICLHVPRSQIAHWASVTQGGVDEEEEELGDEAMMALDENLASLFAEQKLRIQARRDEKNKVQKEKALRRDFQIRVS